MAYPTYAGGQLPVRLTGKRNKDLQGFAAGLQTRMQNDPTEAIVRQYLMDPTGGAGAYLPFFQEAAQGAAAPALRDFQNIVGRQAANVASRFGGAASTEEQRVVTRTSDDFSRNLTEALARIGPQAVTAAQGRGAQLLSARGQGIDLQQMLLQAILGQQQKGSPWARILGTAAGIGASFIPGVGQVAGPAILSATNSGMFG